MLTWLSRSIRRILGRLVPAPVASAPQLAGVIPLFGQRTNALAQRVETRDSAAPVLFQVGASPFVAGQGARLYSLDVFRNARKGGPRPPRRAA